MTMPEYSSDLEKQLHQTLYGYGKVGLLIDDAPQAATRIARAFYGTESLPGWWLRASSVACARDLLQALCEQLQQGKRFLTVVILDRYLPVKCLKRPTRRTIPWDGPLGELGLEDSDKSNCRKLWQLTEFLLALRENRDRRLFFELETSYPHGYWVQETSTEDGSAASNKRALPWKTRSLDLLNNLRRKAQRSGRELLRFGPDHGAIARFESSQSSFADEDDREEARWRAKYWKVTIDSLARDLRNGSRAVLVTGAGGSMRTATFGRGMPATDDLLLETCNKVIRENPDGLWGERAASRKIEDKDRCPCGSPLRSSPGSRAHSWSKKDKPFKTPVRWLLEKVSDGDGHANPVATLNWQLEELFSLKENHDDRLIFKQFRDAFRVTLHRFDNGFMYHHWLLAQIPWSWIITTNFDGYHERAAAEAAALARGSQQRETILRLGSELPFLSEKRRETREHGGGEAASAQEEQIERARQGRRLLKPYGSLLHPGSLGLGSEEIAAYQEAFKGEIRTIINHWKERHASNGRRDWIVVLGHSMADPFINDLLRVQVVERISQEAFENNMRLLWIDPMAWRCTESTDPSRFSRKTAQYWDKLMNSCLEKEEAGPLPAKAHEFVYDLWLSYNER